MTSFLSVLVLLCEVPRKFDLMEEFKHCDDYIDDKNQPNCLRQFLRYCRWPASYQCRAERLGVKKPVLFADWQRYKNKKKRVRLVMASRFGDVGITRDLKAESGYDWRVAIETLSNFCEKLCR